MRSGGSPLRGRACPRARSVVARAPRSALRVPRPANPNSRPSLPVRSAVKSFREGKTKDVSSVVAAESVFRNASRGDVYSKNDLASAFGADAKLADVLARIVMQGTLPVTTEENREAIDAKRKEIVHYLHANYVDPRTGRPHPQTRVEAALDAVKGVTIDPKRSASEQAHEMLRKIVDTGLALKKNEIEGTVTVPKAAMGPATSAIKKFCTTRGSPEFRGESVTFSVGVAPGSYDELMRELGKATAGDFTFDMPTPSAAKPPPAAAAAAASGGGGGKKGGKKGGGGG